MKFREAVQLAEGIIARFEKVENRDWGVEGALIELSKQVGELSKLVMVRERYYVSDHVSDPQVTASAEKIADELADILYAVIRIARHYRIDLEQAHLDAREGEDRYLRSRGV
jgi:NTP pyrophosphatase (non-canonical NTP hydrolase)